MRKSRELSRFARFCFGRLGLAPVAIRCLPSVVLVDPNDNYCFACYTYDETPDLGTKRIWLGYRLPKNSVMWNLAHEIWHYKQDRDGRIQSMPLEECEAEADRYAEKMMGEWLERGGKTWRLER